MLQQTQVKTVIPYWERWMQHFPSVSSLASADEQRVLKLWEGLGYYTRARNLQKAARIICERHQGKFPDKLDQVLELPGIGRYTAGAICSIAYGQSTPILDGNVVRVLARVYLVAGDPKSKASQEKLWELSSALVSAVEKRNACSALNQGLMELGAMICTPREPLCLRCPLQADCGAFQSGRVAEFPQLPPREKPQQRVFVAYILRQGTKVLVRRRSAKVVNGGLWEFPNFEVDLQAAPIPMSLPTLKTRPFAIIKHTITNNRITLRASTAEVNGGAPALAERFAAEWRPVRDLQQLPFSSAHAKLRALLMDEMKAATET